jgi:hypothetical protein
MFHWMRQKSEATPPPPSNKSREAAERPTKSAQGVPASEHAPTSSPPDATTLSLTQLLQRETPLSPEQIENLRDEAKDAGKFLAEILVEKGIFAEQELITFLVKHCRIPYLSLLNYLVQPKIAQLLPEQVCRKYGVLPLDVLGKSITVAMVNPLDTAALRAVQSALSAYRVKPVLCSATHLQAALDKAFGTQRPTQPAPAPPSSEPKSRTYETAPSPNPTVKDLPAEEDLPEAEPLLDESTIFKRSGHLAVAGDAYSNSSAMDTPAASSSPVSPLGQVVETMLESMRETYALMARRFPLFAELNSEEVAQIFTSGALREFKAGEYLCRQGTQSDEFFVLLTGKAEVRLNGESVTVLESGEPFGEMAALTHSVRSADVVGVEDGAILVLTRALLEEQWPRSVANRVLLNLVAILSARLRKRL